MIESVVRGKVHYRMDHLSSNVPLQTLTHYRFRRWIVASQARLAEQNGAAIQKVSPSVELAKRIRALRLAADLTQLQLADAVGVSRAAVAFWETGRAGDINKHLAPLSQALGVNEEALLNGLAEEHIQAELSPDEADLLALYRLLSPSRKLNAQKWIERQAGE
ncbi:helix-turn-helix domain-containing protein [Labrys okinawensis]|nr:helix-turn-helix transcriptional regulator [Labrys okinawensis]